ncbi:MAG: UDP-N-acetylglucosamine 1-carboxyvinyltransferase [Ignavibacteriales bacterium]|nr:UDP-N-acetylglucosamine 1-carboxyvinyltransferase [Ignavibacteriales bacterium]
MDKFVINGGKKLSGTVEVSGAKNSALALMPATLLNSGKNIINNTPEVSDIYTMIKLLNHLGVATNFHDHNLTLDTSHIINQIAPYEHVKKMRASVYVLGPLLSRYGYAKVSMPGGCAWGPRPINLHLEAMKKLGAEIQLEEGYIIAKSKKLQGTKLHFDISSVGATGNALMAASLAKGTTLITNASMEPEITLLAEYIREMGAKISGIGSTILEIEGVDELSSSKIENIADRIEAGTLLTAAAITQSKINLVYRNFENAKLILSKLEDSGVILSYCNKLVQIDATSISPRSVDITTSAYPGFPTDMQAQWTSYMSLADGTSTITESIYYDRFNHVPELNRLGANIEIINNSAVVKGVKELKGAKVMSTDLRASASLVLAGLAALGTTEVLRVYHLDRGYQRIEEKLKALGADIERVSTSEF